MKVKSTQNSGIPAPAQESEASVKDGTSNTVMFAESKARAEKPFSRDAFEAPGSAKSFELMFDSVKAPRDMQSGQFMDYTDDSCAKKKSADD